MGQSDALTRILDGCKSGNAECYSQLLDLYATRCFGYFYRLTGSRDLSEELLSELFMKLVEKMGSYKGGSFESWLFRIASNIFHDHLRAKKRQKKLLEARRFEGEPDSTTGPAKWDVTHEKLDRLQVQLARLDADTQELIMLRFYSELSFKEIAELRSEPLGTALSKLHRGLKKLRQYMEG